MGFPRSMYTHINRHISTRTSVITLDVFFEAASSPYLDNRWFSVNILSFLLCSSFYYVVLSESTFVLSVNFPFENSRYCFANIALIS